MSEKHSFAQSAITLHSVSFDWPDGTVALRDLSGTIPSGRTGLVGRNGSGKSTLLRLVAGILTPTRGHITTHGEIGYLPQTLTLGHSTTVADLLGVTGILTALRAIESGDIAERHFDTVGDDWDIEARADEALDELGFSATDLDRRVGDISGGEAMLIAVAGLHIRRPAITLLDEPTNNLDRAARARLAELIDTWPGAVVVVSHDGDLLERMDATAELHSGRLDVFGGPYSLFTDHLANEQAAAQQAARTAQQALKAEKNTRIEAETKLARRQRTAKKVQASGSIPKILAGTRANRAQGSAGNLRSTLDDRVQAAQAAVDAADSRVRDDEHIHLVLPDPDVPHGRRIAEIGDAERTFVIQGPERVALVGPNGSGKSTLLQHLVDRTDPRPGHPSGILLTDRVGYLPQRLDSLDDSRSAVENVQDAAPGSATGSIRNHLARLLIRGDAADRAVGSLSGGERFRVSLATLLFAEPPVQVLVLDEPTNNLDLVSVDQLVDALATYRGAVLIASHDHAFLARLGITLVLELDAAGGLRAALR